MVLAQEQDLLLIMQKLEESKLSCLEKMARHPIKNLKGDEVGYWDESEFPRIYHTQRSAKDRQIFLHPKYNNAVGLDIRIINKHLIPNQVGVLDFLVVGLEKKSYHAIIR